MNPAARLHVNCEPGKALLNHTTWALVRDEIPREAKDEIRAKGIRDPVKVYEVTARYPIEQRAPEMMKTGIAA